MKATTYTKITRIYLYTRNIRARHKKMFPNIPMLLRFPNFTICVIVKPLAVYIYKL